jgi:hypothetical protein
MSQKRLDLFRYEISVQMLEIYNEQVRDLLNTDGVHKKYPFGLACFWWFSYEKEVSWQGDFDEYQVLLCLLLQLGFLLLHGVVRTLNNTLDS